MSGDDLKSLISATAPRMPEPEPDRRELLKRQAQQLRDLEQMNTRMRETNLRVCPPTVPLEIEQAYISGQVLLYELRKRKRDEGF